jgi:nucleotide-binding universal stress UspA family protein
MFGLVWFRELMKLLIAIDGSTFSAAATQAVIAEAKRDGTEIQAIHVVDTRKRLLPEVAALDTEVMNAPAQRRSAEALVEATARLLRAEGLNTTTVVVWGDPRLKIIEAAKEWSADLIVLGAHGRSGLNGFLMGSVSDAVAHYALCSVEIVRIPKNQLKPQGLRILLAMDDSEFSEVAANAVMTQVKSQGAEVKLMRVLDPFPLAEAEKMGSREYPDFASAVAKLRQEAISQLSKTADGLQTLGFKVSQTVVEEGYARDVILDYADRWRTDLIVLGSHRSKGMRKFSMGSVSEAVSRYADCSVEIVRLPLNQ